MKLLELFKRLKPRLVEDWRDCWKWYSTHALVFNVAMIESWLHLPAEWQAAIPAGMVLKIAIAALALGFIGRLMQQGAGEQKP